MLQQAHLTRRLSILCVLVTLLCCIAARADRTPVGYAKEPTAAGTLAASLAGYEQHKPTFGQWRVLGPFQSRGGGEVEQLAPVKLDATYKGLDGREVRWEKLPKARTTRFSTGEFGMKDRNRHMAIYGHLPIEAPMAGTVRVYLSAPGRSEVWLNGRRIERLGRRSREYNLELQKGANHLLFRTAPVRARDTRVRFYPLHPVEAVVDRICEDFPAREAEVVRAWRRLSKDIRSGMREDVASEALRSEATILPSDRTPLDVVLRRTRALLEKLETMGPKRDLAEDRAALDKLADRIENVGEGLGERIELFERLVKLRRRIALANPLLDFQDIIFLASHRARYEHMCDQYFGFHARPGGGVRVLRDAFGPAATVEDVLDGRKVANGRLVGKELTGGSFISLDLSYDGRRIAFAWTQAEGSRYNWTPESTYHVFAADLAGGEIRMLTDGPVNDFDPCFLPNGRIAFISERRGGFGRCHGRPVPTYTLHSMLPDGGDIITLSYHETNEWHPSVDNAGMLIYTRWDYVDRDSDVAHHPWICYPDGTDPRSFHGNYPENRRARPWMEMSLRAIPDSHRYIGVATPHHGQAYGSMVLIDHRLPDDNEMSQLKRVTPEVRFPESESGYRQNQIYGTPWPLSEEFYLAVYDSEARHYGVYLVDSLGNKVLLHRGAEVPALDPIPLRPRPMPPVIPSRTLQAREDRGDRPAPETSTVAVMNVYDSDQPWPEGTKIRALRIVQLFPKATAHQNDPRVGHGRQSLVRGVLGTVPVEADGSVHFTMPAGIPVYFQALDENGLAIQSMKSDTYTHAGERLTCQGCHEPKRRSGMAVSAKPAPIALGKAPRAIEPEMDGSYPILFPRLVQPVLEARCAGCHARKDKAPSLSGKKSDKVRWGWSEAFVSLEPYAWAKHGGNGSLKRYNGTSFSIPGKVGAKASKLYPMLAKGHHDVKLTDEQMRRITLWLDCNSNFYGAYRDEQAQQAGKVVQPELE